jgi:mersacidin/lichenicidin family type 2 lantibiotic
LKLVARKQEEMNTAEVVRAWKDPAYRASLTSKQLGALPSHPSGSESFAERNLAQRQGGTIGILVVILTALSKCF